MRIFRVEDYLLLHFSVSEGVDGENGSYLKSVLILRLAGAGVAVTLGAVVSLLFHGPLTMRDLPHSHRSSPQARL